MAQRPLEWGALGTLGGNEEELVLDEEMDEYFFT